MRYLLDTDVISNVIRYPSAAAATRVASARTGELGTSIIVSAELKFGYVRKNSKRLEDVVEGVLASLEIAAWEAPSDQAYARLRSHLELRGASIGQNDTLIAAHAIALGVILVSANEKHFRRVPGLRVENWVER